MQHVNQSDYRILSNKRGKGWDDIRPRNEAKNMEKQKITSNRYVTRDAIFYLYLKKKIIYELLKSRYDFKNPVIDQTK